MAYAQAIKAEQPDKDWKHQIVDEVWLLRRHIQTTRPSSNLDFKRLGRFNIIKKISRHAYKLDLPASMKYYPVFHIFLLKPTTSNPLKGQKQSTPPPVIVDNKVEFEAEEILESKRVYKTLKYLFKWVAYDQTTWKPTEFLKNSMKLIHYFYMKSLKKSRPDYPSSL